MTVLNLCLSAISGPESAMDLVSSTRKSERGLRPRERSSARFKEKEKAGRRRPAFRSLRRVCNPA